MQSAVANGFGLSEQQKHAWLAQNRSGSRAVQGLFRIDGDVDLARLKSSVDSVIARHEILRTTFPRPAGMKLPLQSISESLSPIWSSSDIAPPGQSATPTELENEARCQAELVNNLEHGPLVSVSAYRFEPDTFALLITCNSCIADAATVENFIAEVWLDYCGDSLGSLGDPLQYADFSEWQKETLEAEGEATASGKAFWKETGIQPFAGYKLPFEHETQEKELGTVGFILDEPALNDLSAFSTSAGLHEEQILLASWQAALHRFTGSEDIGVRVHSPCRDLDELHGAFGPYSRFLPIHAKITGNETFAALCSSTAESLQMARQFHDFFSWNDQNGSDESAWRSAPGFCYQTVNDPESANGASLRTIWIRAGLDENTLQLECFRASGGLRLDITFDQRAIDPESVRRLGDGLVSIIGSATAGSRTEVGALNVIGATQLADLTTWNETATPSDGQLLVQMFEEHAASHPHRTAVKSGERSLSYRELNSLANRLAHRLRKMGVGRDTCVGLYLDRSVELIAGLLGILKSGGAYVPLNLDHPAERIVFQLKQANAKIVVTGEAMGQELNVSELSLVTMDEIAGDTDLASSDPDWINQPGDLVYVIYTSGSTGTPKGVGNTHGGLAGYTRYMIRRLDLQIVGEQDSAGFALVSSITADLGNTCLFPCLASGGCLHVISNEMTLDAAAFANYARTYNLDVLKITPSHLRALIAGEDGKDILPSRCLVLGGEASAWELIDQIRSKSVCRILNHYGPTETTIGSLTCDIEDEHRSLSSTVPIGKPIANTRVYVLNEHGSRQPVGVSGELCIAGAGVARGYIGMIEETNSRFTPEHGSTDPSARMYRTGDEVRMLPDGCIEFLGRKDDQVKIRGYRVEPGEVAEALRKCPGVADAAVLATEEAGERKLMAYVRATGARPSPESLRQALLAKLPEYMVPSSFVAVESFPLTPSGKIDRQALLSIEVEHAKAQPDRRGPANEVEETIAEIWGQVLGFTDFGMEDDFFEIGGYSLLAIRTMSRMRERLQVELPMSVFFDFPTVAGLAEQVLSRRAPGADDELARLLEELESVSDEDAERILAGELGARTG